jgi:monofunctional biosynthetic peptidoglycan transglycosylase
MSLDWGLVRDDAQAPEVRPPEAVLDCPVEARPSRLKKLLILLVAVPVLLSALYAFVPPVSTLMLARWATLRPVERDWVPLSEISPSLPRAVIAAEDGWFCAHWGVDWNAVRDVLDDGDWPSRGASTISMQVAKNLFLWQGFGWVRKPVEIALAHWLELVWTKRRIMEVYLNVVEWGPNGVFGAEAASRRAFRKSAADLTSGEAAILAAALPNPIVRNAARPGPRLMRRAGRVGARYAETSCLDRY